MNWQSDLNKTKSTFAPILEQWYEAHKRDLPWRHTRDPYYIWISEVILQQTRVAQGRPYYERFIAAYPTVDDMARADEQELLRLWQGLGYYSRARNLHQTARFVTDQLASKFPATYDDLLKMKGIGTYTAAAIASFAYDERVPVVDGNVYRVLARVFGIHEDITTTTAKKTFAGLAKQLIQSATNPATYNQSIMEFGAIQCTPVGPDCLLCPLQQDCVAYQTGQQQRLPVKSKKMSVRNRAFTYLVFRQNGKLALRERVAKDIWQNLYDFYLVEDDPVSSFVDGVKQPQQVGLQEIGMPDSIHQLVAMATPAAPPTVLTQLLSHQRIWAQFYLLDLPLDLLIELPDGLQWYELEAINRLPKPVLITNYLATLLG